LNKLGENSKGNQEWTIQRYMQHWAHKTQDEDKKTKKTQKIEQMNNKEPTKKIGVNPGACEG
jgi:hypothetical protein